MDDISFLVNETYKTVENQNSEASNVPQKCGILYSLAENESTFVIRGLCSKNLKDDLENFTEKKYGEILRIDPENKKDVFWFETEFWERGEMILELATQKRFLKENERLSNLSDPHLYWSLVIEDNSMRVDLSGRKKHNPTSLSIGYIGEVSIALERFSKLLERDFNNDIIEINEQELDQSLYNKLKDLIQYHNFDSDWFSQYLQQKFNSETAEALELYLGEVHTMLNFWDKVLKQIKK